MSDSTDSAAIVTAIAQRAGLPLPTDRMDAIINGFLELETMCALLRSTNLTAADEPANIYSFDPITRIA